MNTAGATCGYCAGRDCWSRTRKPEVASCTDARSTAEAPQCRTRCRPACTSTLPYFLLFIIIIVINNYTRTFFPAIYIDTKIEHAFEFSKIDRLGGKCICDESRSRAIDVKRPRIIYKIQNSLCVYTGSINGIAAYLNTCSTRRKTDTGDL